MEKFRSALINSVDFGGKSSWVGNEKMTGCLFVVEIYSKISYTILFYFF